MAGSGDRWQPALLDLRHRRRHQSCARANHHQISRAAERKRVVAKPLGKTFVAITQLQCSRKSTSFAVIKPMKNHSKTKFYCMVTAKRRMGDRGQSGELFSANWPHHFFGPGQP